jgi:phytoene dehydrogenase-like protein
MPDTSSRLDAVIIGAGHNGLVCASYLARAGLKVRVYERRRVIGGAAVTQEFAPGFRNSVAAYTVSLLQPKIIRDLRLHEHGLRVVERPFANFLPLPNGDAFQVGPDLAATQRQLARFSKRDAARLPDYYAMVERVAAVLRGLVLKTPPNMGGGLRDIGRAWSLGFELKRLDMPSRRDLLQFFTRSAGEILDDWFESDAVKGAFGFDSVVGNFASPYAAGSGYVLLHHAFGEVNGRRGSWGHAIGGMGAITAALAAEARRHGVEIVTDAAVSKVMSRNGRASGIVLADGIEIAARTVIGNLNPKLLYLDLVEAKDLEPDFVARMQGWRCASGSFRMNVALAELPDFNSATGYARRSHTTHPASSSAPSLEYHGSRLESDARATACRVNPWSRSSSPAPSMIQPGAPRAARRQPVLPAVQSGTAQWTNLGCPA